MANNLLNAVAPILAGPRRPAPAANNHPNNENEPVVASKLYMSGAETQDYILSFVEYLYGKLTSSEFLELIRRSVTFATARWLLYSRDFDYGQVFRFYLKGTSAAGILTANANETPFIWQRTGHLSTINDIDIMLIVNPFLGQIDYTILRSLLIVRLIEVVNEWINDPSKSFRGNIYTDDTTSAHLFSSPLRGQFNDECYTLQKTVFNEASSRIIMPETCPFFYTLHNNLIVQGVPSGISLLKIKSRPYLKSTELIDIVIPSHEYSRVYIEWALSDTIILHSFNATTLMREISVPILHPQYLAGEFMYAIEADSRPEKIERRTDALNALIKLLAENHVYKMIHGTENNISNSNSDE